MTATGWVRTALGMGATVALAAATGCGSGPAKEADGGHAAFLRSVDAVCARAVSAHAGHSFPVEDFDPESPDPSELPAVGAYFARYGGLPATTTRLHALHPPSGDSAAWHDLLADADTMASNAERQIDAARTRDSGTFVTTVHTANDLIDGINADAARLGISAGSPCRQVFG